MTQFRVTDEITLIPVLHYSVDSAVKVSRCLKTLRPDAIAIELPSICHEFIIQGVHRLPDISSVRIETSSSVHYIPIEPCDPLIEACRVALDKNIPVYSIDLFENKYPDFHDYIIDPYAIKVLGLERYVEMTLFQPMSPKIPRSIYDEMREEEMAQRIFELSLRHGHVVAFIGLYHLFPISQKIRYGTFLSQKNKKLQEYSIDLISYPEGRVRELLMYPGYITEEYEAWRSSPNQSEFDTLILYSKIIEDALAPEVAKDASLPKMVESVMNYFKRISRVRGGLVGSLRELIESTQGMLGQRASYLVWKKATSYPYLKNIDNLPEIDLKPQDLWGSQATIRFRPTIPSHKSTLFETVLRHEEDHHNKFFSPRQTICSYPAEDIIIESFGKVIQKRGLDLLQEESKKTMPFTSSMEDGVHIQETIRKRIGATLPIIYVEKREVLSGKVGSCVVIFHEDTEEALTQDYSDFPWAMTWQGEHTQESDMAFYATNPMAGIVGPGIARCTYGGFLLSYPPRRLFNVWYDPEYTQQFLKRQDILLAAGIDYSLEPIIIYTAPNPPSSDLVNYASVRGKRIVFIPIQRFSQKRMKRLQIFHILDSKERRDIAQEYINDIVFD